MKNIFSVKTPGGQWWHGEFSVRYDLFTAAKLLLGGRTYDQIVKEVEISTATISRINRCIQYGTGGYQSVIEKISAQEKKQ